MGTASTRRENATVGGFCHKDASMGGPRAPPVTRVQVWVPRMTRERKCGWILPRECKCGRAARPSRPLGPPILALSCHGRPLVHPYLHPRGRCAAHANWDLRPCTTHDLASTQSQQKQSQQEEALSMPLANPRTIPRDVQASTHMHAMGVARSRRYSRSRSRSTRLSLRACIRSSIWIVATMRPPS